MAPDLVQRRCNPKVPNQPWCGNSSYIATDAGWLHLAAVIDPFSRHLVGLGLRPHMQTSLAKDALAMACWRRRPEPGRYSTATGAARIAALSSKGHRKKGRCVHR